MGLCSIPGLLSAECPLAHAVSPATLWAQEVFPPFGISLGFFFQHLKAFIVQVFHFLAFFQDIFSLLWMALLP